MIACTRCGRLHTDVEAFLGKRLSCTEIKQFWAQIKKEHKAKYGHYAQIIRDDTKGWICFECNRKLF